MVVIDRFNEYGGGWAPGTNHNAIMDEVAAGDLDVVFNRPVV